MQVLSTRVTNSKFNIWIKSIVVICFLLLSDIPSIAEERIPLATGEWRPYTSAEIEGYGFFSEIVTAVFKEADIDITYNFYPWKRCAAYVKSGDIFAAFPYSITNQRKNYASFSDPVSETTTVFFYNRKKHENPIDYDRIDEQKKYTIVGVLGYYYAEAFKKANLDVMYVTTEQKALELIYHQRYDIFPLSNYVGWNLIKKLYPKDYRSFTTCKKPLDTTTLHLMVSKKYPNYKSLIKKFNTALIRVKEKGIYQEILSRHAPDTSVEMK